MQNNNNPWNKIYESSGQKYKHYDIFQAHEDMKKISEVFKDEKINKLLDLGCGAGRNLLFLANQGFEVSGIDISSEGLDLVRDGLEKNNLDSDLKQGNVFESLPYNDKSFDAIISVQVMQHGTEKEILKGISEIERVLKDNGIIFITLAGRVANGQVRYCLVKTAKQIEPRTYIPQQGSEVGLTHYIYNKEMIKKHYKNFKILSMWIDSKGYYCFIAKK